MSGVDCDAQLSSIRAGGGKDLPGTPPRDTGFPAAGGRQGRGRGTVPGGNRGAVGGPAACARGVVCREVQRVGVRERPQARLPGVPRPVDTNRHLPGLRHRGVQPVRRDASRAGEQRPRADTTHASAVAAARTVSCAPVTQRHIQLGPHQRRLFRHPVASMSGLPAFLGGGQLRSRRILHAGRLPNRPAAPELGARQRADGERAAGAALQRGLLEPARAGFVDRRRDRGARPLPGR